MTAVWYRFRAELRSRWPAMAAVALLVGIATATVVTAAVGARRTASTVERYIDATRTNDVFLQLGEVDARALDAMERLPEVETLARLAGMAVFADAPGYAPFWASVDGREGRTINRAPILEGRRADPEAVEEVVVSEATADQLRVRSGSRLRLVSYSPEQAPLLEQEGLTVDPAGPAVTVTVVGIARTGNDLSQRSQDPSPSLLTPAFYRRHREQILTFETIAMVRLRAGDAAVPEFRNRVDEIVGPDAAVGMESVTAFSAPLDEAVGVLASGLWIFAAISGLAGLVALGVVLGRQAFLAARDDPTLSAIGMSRWGRFTAGLAPVLPAAIVGAALGIGGALAASPLLPMGLARRAEPDPGLYVDGSVLLAGFGVAVTLALVIAAVAGWRESGRSAAPEGSAPPSGGRRSLASRLSQAGAGPATVTGVRMAFDRGRGRTAVPVRPALVGAVAGIGGVVAVLTFSAGLQRLTSTPARYGFGWDVQVVPGPGPDPDPALLRDLRRDPEVEAVAQGLFQLSIVVEGRPVNATAIRAIEGEMSTTIIEGRSPRGPDEIVLGGDTLDRLDRAVGDAVRVEGPAGSRRFVVVGRGVFPSPDDPLPFADGAALTGEAVDALRLGEASLDSFSQHLVRWAPGVDRDASRARLARKYELIEPSAPPEIERLTQVDKLPRVLSGFLALLAVFAVGHALVTAVHRRRHDFAVLQTLGFVSRQLSAVVAWQASALVVVGLVLGIPLGLVAGRWSWALVARGIGVATDPALSVMALLLAVPAALLVVNVVAFVPGRIAARTKPALTLRAE
jgi:hypothetical protein